MPIGSGPCSPFTHQHPSPALTKLDTTAQELSGLLSCVLAPPWAESSSSCREPGWSSDKNSAVRGAAGPQPVPVSPDCTPAPTTWSAGLAQASTLSALVLEKQRQS